MGTRKTLERYRARLQAGEEINCGICRLPIRAPFTRLLGGITVDHILPKKLGGDDHDDNFQPAHQKCNNFKGHETTGEFQERHALKVLKAYAEGKDSLRHRWNTPMQLHGYLQRLQSAHDKFSSHPGKVFQERTTLRLEWRWEKLYLELCAYSWLRQNNSRGAMLQQTGRTEDGRSD